MADLYTSNTNGFPDRGPAVLGVASGTLALCSVFVASRLYCRAAIVQRVSWDDYLITLAWVLAFGLSFTISLGTRKGLGRHDQDIDPSDLGALRRCEYVFSILYNPALMAAKSSILIFYLRLSKNTQPVLRIASYAVLGIVNVTGVVLTLMNIFQCRPVEAAFNQVNGSAQCIPLLTEFICSAPVNVVTDLAILVLPIPVLTGMRLPTRQKTILIITFALGVFVTIVDVVRIYYLQQAINYVPTGTSSDPNSLFGDSNDFSWNASLSFMWSAVEVNIGITCACIPTLKPLITKILPAMITDPHGNHTASDETRDLEVSTKRASKEATQHPTTIAAGGGLSAPPPTRVADGENDSEGMTMLDFLTTPDMAHGSTEPIATNSPTRQRGQTRLTASTIATTTTNARQENSVYFGFVNMKRPKSMLKTSASDSFKYCAVVTSLFFLWGFSYGLLNTLNNVVARVANISPVRTLALTSAYFGGGYFFGPLLVGEWVLRHDEHHRSRRRASNPTKQDEMIGGFKATFMVGLMIYGTGTIMFWPSAVLTSFPGFIISNFIVGFGLGVLECAANPFIALCGPMEYAETRLLLAQGIQGVGSVLSPLLAQNVYFVSTESADSTTLLDVQWTYLAITLFCVVLALFFYYMPLPEVSDAELEKAASNLPVDTHKRCLGGLKLRTVLLILAIAAQWCYVAAQESMSVFFANVLTSWLPAGIQMEQPDLPPGFTVSIPNLLVLAHAAFTISRFATGYLAYLSVKHPSHKLVPTPRTMLTVSAILSWLFALLTVVLKPGSNPNLIIVPVILYFLAEGPLWPLIFAMGLRGQGKRTKRAAVGLTMGGSGPAFWPYVIYAIVNRGGSIQTAFIIVVVLLLVTVAYPLYMTFGRDARRLVDPGLNNVPSTDDLGGEGGLGEDHDMDVAVARRRRGKDGEKGGGFVSRFSRKRDRRKTSTAATASPVVEHFEESGGGGLDQTPPPVPEER